PSECCSCSTLYGMRNCITTTYGPDPIIAYHCGLMPDGTPKASAQDARFVKPSQRCFYSEFWLFAVPERRQGSRVDGGQFALSPARPWRSVQPTPYLNTPEAMSFRK